MELEEGITFIRKLKRVSTIEAAEQLQKRFPQAPSYNLLTVDESSQGKQWAVEIWQRPATQQSYQNLKVAVQLYNTEASSESLAKIHEQATTFVDVRDSALEAQNRRQREFLQSNKVARKMRSGLDKFCSTLYSFAPVLDVMANAAPEYVQLSWGVIRFLLQMNVNSAEIKEKVMQSLGDIGERFEMLRCFLGLYPTKIMADHVCAAYCKFNEFMAEAVKYYTENCIKRFFKNVSNPYPKRFDPIHRSINDHIERVKELATLGQGFAIAENTALTMQMKQKLEEDSNRHSLVFGEIAGLLKEYQKQATWENDRRAQVTQNSQQQKEQERLETAQSLLSLHGFVNVLAMICPPGCRLKNTSTDELSTLLLVNEVRGGGDSTSYESLGLLENASVLSWAEARKSSFLWIDGFQSRPDWTTQLSLDTITAAKRTGSVALFIMCDEQGQEKGQPMGYNEWVWTLLAQLFTQRPEKFSGEKQAKIITAVTKSYSSAALWDIFCSCIRDIDFGFVYLVVNNIDTLAVRESRLPASESPSLNSILLSFKKLAEIPDRCVKILVTARRSFPELFPPNMARYNFSIVAVPHTMTARRSQQGVFAATRKPPQRNLDRLPDRDTDHDVKLSDDDDWDSEELDHFLQSTDDEERDEEKNGEQSKKKVDIRRIEHTEIERLQKVVNELKSTSGWARGLDRVVKEAETMLKQLRAQQQSSKNDLMSDDSLEDSDSLKDSLDDDSWDSLDSDSDEGKGEGKGKGKQKAKPKPKPKPKSVGQKHSTSLAQRAKAAAKAKHDDDSDDSMDSLDSLETLDSLDRALKSSSDDDDSNDDENNNTKIILNEKKTKKGKVGLVESSVRLRCGNSTQAQNRGSRSGAGAASEKGDHVVETREKAGEGEGEGEDDSEEFSD